MAARRKSTVFRIVTGLIRDQADEDFKTSLGIDENLSKDEKSQIKTEITIVPFCYECDQERAAPVQFAVKCLVPFGVDQQSSERRASRDG